MISAKVYMWGKLIGAVTQEVIGSPPRFQYNQDFINSGIEVSPIVMPLSDTVYSFPRLSTDTFHGLPGLLADSLPDKFGTALLARYLSEQGRSINSVTSVERLLYTGKRGMGALEYVPPKNYIHDTKEPIDIPALVELATEILTQREILHLTFNKKTMAQILEIGTSAGGARAKAIVAWNPDTNDIRSGQINAGDGYEYWLIKFDGVGNNKDKGDKADGESYTRIEFAYSLMAKAAGIQMSECRLYKESGLYHFMTKRFDRDENGQKLHMQSLGAIAHYDFNSPCSNSYEQAAMVMHQLGLNQDEIEELYRRMVFNIIARNQDDHVKNISFLMGQDGVWSLAPAYDITYANDSHNRWLAKHQMTVNGKSDGFLMDDLLQAAQSMNIYPRTARQIINIVQGTVQHWPDFAEAAYLPGQDMEAIRRRFLQL